MSEVVKASREGKTPSCIKCAGSLREQGRRGENPVSVLKSSSATEKLDSSFIERAENSFGQAQKLLLQGNYSDAFDQLDKLAGQISQQQFSRMSQSIDELRRELRGEIITKAKKGSISMTGQANDEYLEQLKELSEQVHCSQMAALKQLIQRVRKE